MRFQNIFFKFSLRETFYFYKTPCKGKSFKKANKEKKI